MIEDVMVAETVGLFDSFLMGGFECATHRRGDRSRIDVIAASGHDRMAARDYQLLQRVGINTVRDGLRWHLIETADGVYDWSSFLPMLDASIAGGTQVIWDLCHWGVPDHVDLFSPEFPEKFARFARAAAEVVKGRSSAIPLYAPVNEISFWAWMGGDLGGFPPYGMGRGGELKLQLVRASIAGMRAVREVDARARFVQPEPIINISAAFDRPEDREEAAGHTRSQYEAWDLLCGKAGGAGGTAEMLDVIGVNYYWNNEWIHNGERTPLGHPLHRPLHEMLREIWERYGRPIVITETGAEGGSGVGWTGYVMSEVRQAIRDGVEMLGVCLYPVMDYPGWEDSRHCRCGLIEVEAGWGARELRGDMAAEVALQEGMMRSGVGVGV